MNTNSVLTSSAGSVAPIPTGQGNNQTSINDILPEDMIQEILGRLPPSVDDNTAPVCRLWNRVVKELPDPTLKVFGKEAWEEYYNFKIEGEIPPLPEKIDQISRALRRRLKGEKEAPTCSAILMPKGLTLNMLKELMQNPINVHQPFFDKFGDEPIKEAYWFMMTDDVIEGSRNKNYKNQNAHVKQKAGSEYGLPKLIEAIVCCAMHHASSGKRLFGTNPKTYTRCQDKWLNYPLVVGNFASDGPRVFINLNGGARRFYSGGPIVEDTGFDVARDRFGAAASRKFRTPEAKQRLLG